MNIYKISDTKSEEFKKWFGNWEDPNAMSSRRKEPSSFAINEDGTPRTFYHGTTKDFSEFEVGKEGINSNTFGSWKTTRHAIFFTPDPQHANAFTTQGEEFVGGRIIPVYLDIKSPLDFRNGITEDIIEEFETKGVNPRWLRNFNWAHFDDEDGKLFVEAAIQLGYDGVIFKDENPSTRNTSETWAVFDPSQIKSALGNVAANNYKVYKISGVSEFMSGVRMTDLQKYPPQNKLTEKQKEEIRKKTLDMNDSVTRMEYAIKFPKIAYFSIWDLKKCIQWGQDEESCKQAWTALRQRDELAWGIPSGLPDWVYQDIVKYKPKSLSVSTAGDILSASDSYPGYFIKFLAKKYPEIWDAINTLGKDARKALIKQYLEFPNELTLAAISSSLDAREMDRTNPEQYKLKSPYERILSFEIERFLMRSKPLKDKISHSMSDKNRWGGDWETTGKEMVNAFTQIAYAYEDMQEVSSEDHPFSLIVENTEQFGVVRTLFMGSYAITIDLLYDIEKLVNQDLGNYWLLSWGNTIKQSMERNNIPVPKNIPEDGVYVMTEGKYFPVGKKNKSYTSLSGIDSRDPISALNKAKHLESKEKAGIFDEWVEDQTSKRNIAQDDHFYLSLVHSEAVVTLTEEAGRNMFQTMIQGDRLLTQNDFEQGVRSSFGNVWPFHMQSAIKFWNRVPVKVRAVAANEVDLWFVSLSGLFPCDKVLDRSTSSMNDLEKVVKHLNCLGDSEKLREAAQQVLSNTQKEVNQKLRDKLPEFLKSEYVKKFNITDFPEVYEYAQTMLKKNISSGKSYQYESGKDVSKWEYSLSKLKQHNIYMVDANAYKSILGEDGKQLIPNNPDKTAGFYCSSYSMFDDSPCIIIFTNNIAADLISSEIILKELGIEATSGDISLKEEGVLWHEISHDLMEQVSPGHQSDKIQSGSDWLSSPEEVAAITYGNLQYIKRRIKQYFEKAFPFPKRITEGLLAQIKSDIIDTFGWEFQGMTKPEALASIAKAMPNFNQESMKTLNAMTKEEQVNSMTNMFTEFFMRKLTRGKVEDEMKAKMNEIGKGDEKIEFGEEPIVPEKYDFEGVESKDKFIQELEKHPDYPQFINACQEIITNAYNSLGFYRFIQYYRPYVKKSFPNKIIAPENIKDLLLLLFGSPATITNTNLENLNNLFESVIPPSLLQSVKQMVLRERQLQSVEQKPYHPTPVSPDEAEETGQFMAEMDEAHGPDWMWIAKNKLSWYKSSGVSYRFLGPDKDWFKEGAIIGYTRWDNMRSKSAYLTSEQAAAWKQKDGILHESLFGLQKSNIGAWTWIYDIHKRHLDSWANLPEYIKEVAMEEVNKTL